MSSTHSSGKANASWDHFIKGLKILAARQIVQSGEIKQAFIHFVEYYERQSADSRLGIQSSLQKHLPSIYTTVIYALDQASNQSGEDKQRWFAWLRSRLLINPPYDVTLVQNDISMYQDLESLRNSIHRDISNTFQEDKDRQNAINTAAWCRENDIRLVCGRFSRAFYIDGMLMGSAKRLPSSSLKTAITAITRLLSAPVKGINAPLYLGAELQSLENLLAKVSFSLAEINGILERLKKALSSMESKLTLQAEKQFQGQWKPLKQSLSTINQFTLSLREKISQLEEKLQQAPKKDPALLVFFQRLTNTGAINIGLLNEKKDPFFSEDEEIQHLLRESGHHLYVTPHLQTWLRKCDDWIEALPAYASYAITPKENGGYQISAWVQRASLEEMYRRHADDWAENIQDVMRLEEIEIARQWLTPATTKATDPINYLKKNRLESVCAGIAVLIHQVAFNKAIELSQLQAAGKTRQAGLNELFLNAIHTDKSLKFLFTKSDSIQLSKALNQYLEKSGLITKLEHYLPLVFLNARTLPCAHVLTTLGPGETEVHIESWLEESMLLYNLVQHYHLEKDVQKKVKHYQQEIIQASKGVIQQQELNGTLLGIIKEDGLDENSPDHVDKSILKLILSFPEIAREVAKVLNLTPAQLNKRLDRTFSVLTARREVIVENNLLHEQNNPYFRYESAGSCKRYHLLYTPSRVDLGVEEVYSVQGIPKWLGGKDQAASVRGKELYSLYNANPQSVPSPRLAEFMKVGENFFTRGGVYYLSLAAGANIDALGIGDFEYFRDQWNMRGDRLVLPTGETYGGFCVPKEFTLLFSITLAAVDPVTSKQVLNGFGIPESLHTVIISDLKKLLGEKLNCHSTADWELKVQEYLLSKYPEYFKSQVGSFYLPNIHELLRIFEKSGVISTQKESLKQDQYKLVNWINKKAQGLEEINRVGPFRKIHLIRQLLDQARVLNPKVAPDESILGVMTASYKEGAIKDGREIPITDVRFSASARKLEIISGTYEKHLLKDIDPEGRDVIKDILKGFNTFGDVRMVGTCTGSDLLNYVPGSGLEDVKESVNNLLLEAGLTQATIDANCKVYGARLSKWVGIRELPENTRKQLLDKIGNQIHLLVIDRRGTSATYEEAIQGVDFIDLGIPDPGLLDLLDNLPKLVYLMRKGNPDSALVLADGTSGGRRRSFSFRYASSRRKVKDLCALYNQVIYGCLGLGDETVQMWRTEVYQERQLAADLLEAVRNKNRPLAESLFAEIRNISILEEKAEKAAVDEKKARDNGVWSIDDRYLSRFYGKLKSGMTLDELDFGSWLLLGGMYLLNGKCSTDEFASISKEYKKLQASRKFSPFFKDIEINQIMDGFLRPLYQPPADDEYREMKTGIGGSLKAVEEKVARLEKLNERRKIALKLMGLKQRKQAFEKEYASLDNPSLFNTVDGIYQGILKTLPVTSRLTQEDTGKLIASLRRISEVLIADLQDCEKSLKDNSAFVINFTNDLAAHLNGNELTLDDYKLLSRYYEHTAELCAMKDSKESLAKAMELLDILWLGEKTLPIDSRGEMMNEIARFFDVTLNNHIFDYIPYHYHTERGTGFKSYSRSELIELSTRHHQWLYQHISCLIAQETELSELPLSYRNLWMGNALEGLYPLGVNLENKTDQFWFSYARLRDLSVLRHEGIVLPQVINGLPGELLKTSERANVVIIYPHGNTTVPVALEQGAKLSRNDQVNLILSAFPVFSQDKHKTSLKIQDAFMFITQEDFQAIQSHASYDASINPPVENQSERVLIMAKFTAPIEPHAIFFHFTHYLRPVIDTANLPIIQPFLWEAATHLKCRLPEMLKGSGVRTADQDNWYQKDTLAKPEKTVRRDIETMIKTMAKTHDTLIIKSEKESGGRSAMILPVQRDGQLLDENIQTLANQIYKVSRVDNVVLQQVLKSHVRRLYTPEFLDDMVNRFIKIGIPVNLERDPKSPLFSYFRLIVIKGPSGYRITHNITVISTQGVANVGQGGLLYEYTDACIHPKYRDFLRKEMELAAFNSMASQQKYLKANGKCILTEYLEAHPEFRDQIDINEEIKHTDIPYEMGDYMPVMLVDAQDCLTHVFDRTSEKVLPLFANGKPTGIKVYDKSGKPVAAPYPMFDAQGKLIKRYNNRKELLPPLAVFKIEPNPGAGLWRPHNDQLPADRKGEGVYLLFQALGEIAKEFKRKKK